MTLYLMSIAGTAVSDRQCCHIDKEKAHRKLCNAPSCVCKPYLCCWLLFRELDLVEDLLQLKSDVDVVDNRHGAVLGRHSFECDR